MKKLFTLAFAAFALTSFGAWEKIATARLADVDSLVKGVARFGEFSGNQMLGIMASQAVGQNPLVTFFGPGRPGVAMSFELYVDGSKFSASSEELFDSMGYAVLYPISQTKAEFMASHIGAVETNGLVRVALNEDECEEEPAAEESCLEGDFRYIAFSKDGKWATYSEKPEQAKIALDGIAMAERKMEGDLAQILVEQKGWGVLARALDELSKAADVKEKDRADYLQTAACLRQLASFSLGARVDGNGLDFRALVRVAPESDLFKIGLKALPAEAFTFAGEEAFCAVEVAEDAGSKAIKWESVCEVLKKHGLELPYLTVVEPKPNQTLFTLDLLAADTYLRANTNAFEKLDVKKLIDDLSALGSTDELFPLKNPAMSVAMVIKSYKPPANPRARFEATLPEAKGKPVYARMVVSYYSILQALAPFFLDDIEPSIAAAIKPMLSTLPAEGKSGIAYAAWREKDAHACIIRIGADEIKGITACGAVAAALAFRQQQVNEPAK